MIDVTEKFQAAYEKAMAEIKEKYDLGIDDKKAQALGGAITQAIIDGLAAHEEAREAKWAAASDPVAAWERTLKSAYPSCPDKQPSQADQKAAVKDAAHAWGAGERWASSSLYPSMDFESREATKK